MGERGTVGWAAKLASKSRDAGFAVRYIYTSYWAGIPGTDVKCGGGGVWACLLCV